MYNWASESYGSEMVRRHAVAYLCRHFSRLANSTLLFELEESLLVEALASDFVQVELSS